MIKPITFLATIPPTETAIKVHGESGARVMLDISDTELLDFLPAINLRGKVIKVTLEEANQ